MLPCSMARGVPEGVLAWSKLRLASPALCAAMRQEMPIRTAGTPVDADLLTCDHSGLASPLRGGALLRDWPVKHLLLPLLGTLAAFQENGPPVMAAQGQ